MSEIIVKEFDGNIKIWDDFVEDSINGTIFHEQKFISYHKKGKFQDNSLLFYSGNQIISIFPAAIVIKNGKKVLKSHPGTSYGGFVLSKRKNLKLNFELIYALEKYSKKNKVDLIEFRHSPPIFRKESLDQLDFALLHNGYKRLDEELSTCFELTRYRDMNESDVLDCFNKFGRSKPKKNINKAIREGLSFRILQESEYKKYYEILCKNLTKHKASPVHSFEDIFKLKALYPKRVELYGVFLEDKMIAGYLIFQINKIGRHIFYGSVDYNYQEYRPTSYGLFKLIKTFADAGDVYLNMGISTEDGGKIINWDLFAFKESFNGTGTLRTYWQKNLND